MDFSKFANDKLTNVTTKKSYTATYNAHLSQFANEDGVITEEQIPAVMEYITTSNRRQSTKNCMLVILTRMMLYSGIDKSLTTDVKQQFSSAPLPMPSRRHEIEQYIERLFKCGDMKSYVINYIMFGHDVSEDELRSLVVSDKQPTIRCIGIFVRPNYVTIQSKDYPQFNTHGIKKIRIHSARCRDILKEYIGRTLIDDMCDITDFLMNGLSEEDYSTEFLNGLTGVKRTEYLKYR
jgi:hypothetical protein